MVRGAPRILFVAPELAPWAKVGGLGDVCHDLPPALAAAGLDVRILVPAYPALEQAFPGALCVAEFPAPGGVLEPARLLQARGPVPLYLIDCPPYYARAGVYQSPDGTDWADNHLRYGLLSRVAAILAGAESPLSWRPHVVHCHDWQSGLAPMYLAHRNGRGAASVLTIHNLAYQGVFPPHVLRELAIPGSAFTVDGLEYYGNVSFLKAGLTYADKLITVSPTYAREIQGAELGFGLDSLLRRRAADLVGVLNGIDREAWDPARDRHLAQDYDRDRLERKVENKIALQCAFGLPVAPDLPLFATMGRLVWQKGIDLLIEAAHRIVSVPAQLIVLGQGEREIEAGLRALAARHPGAVAVQIGFEERVAHQIAAGADIFLMPSRYEPCGLTQLHSMRYGALPVVHRTGGLADSVADTTEESLRAGAATGFAFDEFGREGFLDAVQRALSAYRAPQLWRSLQRNAMARNDGWTSAAAVYASVYRAAAGRKWPRPAAAPDRIATALPARSAAASQKSGTKTTRGRTQA